MRSIPLLVIDDAGLYDDIALAKREPRKALMQTERAKVLTRYRAYEHAAPEVGALPLGSFGTKEKEALLHAYDSETEPLERFRADCLARIEVARCPFCGISESSTLDHYLPKERYPEFSVFTKNLVPSCASCNNRKRDKIVIDGSDIRRFLHPYYDSIPQSNFLTVNIQVAREALLVRFGLIKPPRMSNRTFSHISSHFKVLDLADRYRRMGLENLGGLHGSLERAYGNNLDSRRVSSTLEETADDLVAAHGSNFWLVVLYRALALDSTFCDGGFIVIKPRVGTASRLPGN